MVDDFFANIVSGGGRAFLEADANFTNTVTTSAFGLASVANTDFCVVSISNASPENVFLFAVILAGTTATWKLLRDGVTVIAQLTAGSSQINVIKVTDPNVSGAHVYSLQSTTAVTANVAWLFANNEDMTEIDALAKGAVSMNIPNSTSVSQSTDCGPISIPIPGSVNIYVAIINAGTSVQYTIKRDGVTIDTFTNTAGMDKHFKQDTNVPAGSHTYNISSGASARALVIAIIGAGGQVSKVVTILTPDTQASPGTLKATLVQTT